MEEGLAGECGESSGGVGQVGIGIIVQGFAFDGFLGSGGGDEGGGFRTLLAAREECGKEVD